MRGCSRSRITPAVFSHSRALLTRAQEVVRVRVGRVHSTRADDRDTLLERDGVWDRHVARSIVARKKKNATTERKLMTSYAACHSSMFGVN
jgi:IS4 transposase